MTADSRPTGLLRVLLRALAAMRGLAPASRRRDWYRQWRADVWHESQWVSRAPGPQPQAATALAVKVAGAARHALWLRFYIRRLEMISHDLRYGWRLMVRRPAFTAIAIAMLGLGIGASVTIFSWLQTALQPIPGVPDRDRLVMLQGTTRTRNDLSTSYPNLVDYRERRPASITDIAGQTFVPLNLTVGRSPQRIYGLIVTGNYFDVLGVRPVLGRGRSADPWPGRANRRARVGAGPGTRGGCHPDARGIAPRRDAHRCRELPGHHRGAGLCRDVRSRLARAPRGEDGSAGRAAARVGGGVAGWFLRPVVPVLFPGTLQNLVAGERCRLGRRARLSLPHDVPLSLCRTWKAE
jgi:MacB-like protein